MRIIGAFAVLLLVAQPTSANAQIFGEIGTRAEGMGGAFVAVADDASAVYWNPAGIANGSIFDLQVSVAKGSTVFVGAAVPVFGLSYYRAHQAVRLPTVSPPPDREHEGSGQVPIRTLTTSNIGLTVVQTIVPGLVIGSTTRIVSGAVEPAEGRTTVDFDAGAMVSAWDARFGFTVRNLLQPEFDTGSGPVHMTRQFRIGAALAPRSATSGVHGPFSLAVDADLTSTPGPFGLRRFAAAGGEFWPGRGYLGVRGGVRWSTLGDTSRALSGGITLRLPKSMYVEGQLTKSNEVNEKIWNVGGGLTF